MNILIIEDDMILASQIAHTFYHRVMTHRIDTLTSLDAFHTRKHTIHMYDIILVDLILSPFPSFLLEGYSIIETIHATAPHIPIIVMSAIDTVDSLRRAFDLGAIDYIMKPFRLSELEVRVEHWFSRFYISDINTYTHTSIGDFYYDVRENIFYKGNIKLPLSRMSKYLLSLFLIKKGSLVSHDFLRERIWGDYDLVRERNIRIAILRLRRALEPFALHNWIQTVPGEGYIFAPCELL